MNSPPIGIGLLGAGFLARTRTRCYRAIPGGGARVVAVAARSPEHASAFAREHHIPRALGSAAELVRHPDVDIVDLCVPNRWHRPFLELAVAAGKHVVCTKPLSAYVGQDLPADAPDAAVSARDRQHMREVAIEDAEQMLASTRAAGVRLIYGENWIYAPAIVKARELLGAADATILEVEGREAHSGSHSAYSKLWRATGGGALLRLAAHPIGAMLHLKSSEGLRREGRPIRPVSVTAEVADLSRLSKVAEHGRLATGWIDVENWGVVTITFDDGSRARASGNDVLLGGMESRLEILASNCHFDCRLSPTDLLRAYAATPGTFANRYLMEKLDGDTGWSTPIPDEDWTSGHIGLCTDAVHCVRDGREPMATGELGTDVIRVVYAAYVAAATGQRTSL